MIKLTTELQAALRSHGVESFHTPGHTNLPKDATFEPPCGIKWIAMLGQFHLGAFSYAVSGHFARVNIGRYCSIGEQVQIGRSNHPMSGVSTSPFFYHKERLFDVGEDFDGADAYHAYAAPSRHFDAPFPGVVSIGNDVWIGQGAYIRPGVIIGDGAVIGAMSVVMKDVPPFSIVAGNPATVRKWRIPPALAEQMIETAWWRFAPWQLAEIDFTSPAGALDQLRDLESKFMPYQPTVVRLIDLSSTL
jgi:acetyltransferase-like isoleucine patch superfamily enzyme